MPRPVIPSLTPYTSQLPDVGNPATWSERTPLFWNWVTGPGYTNLDDLIIYSEASMSYIDAGLVTFDDDAAAALAAFQALSTSTINAAQASADAAEEDRVQTGLDRVQTGEDRTATSQAVADALAAILPLGMPFPVWDHLTGCPIPSNAGTAKFIKLTAGLTGAGQYNEGLLVSESVSGSAPEITATAVLVGGPMNGQTVPLVNTEQAFLRPRTTSGVLQADEFRQHAHANGSLNTGLSVPAGATYGGFTNEAPTGAAGGDETRPRNRSATYYMRIV